MFLNFTLYRVAKCLKLILDGWYIPGKSWLNNAKKRDQICLNMVMVLCKLLILLMVAEKAGFEPAVRYYRTHAFQACTFNHSVTSPFDFQLDAGVKDKPD